MRDLLVLVLAALVLLGGLFALAPEWFGVAPTAEAASTDRKVAVPPVLVAPVTSAAFGDRLEALGTVLANESIEITSARADFVASVHFEDGDVVEKGDLLVQLQDEEERAQLAEAVAERARSDAELERISELAERRIRSSGDLDAARAQAEAARARVARLEAILADYQIKAPFSGRLGFRRVSAGAYLRPSSVVTTLDDLSVVRVDIAVPETWLALVRSGQEVALTSEAFGDQVFHGVIRSLGTRLDPGSRTVTARAQVRNDDPQNNLRPGMLLEVAIDRGERPVLQVPEEALIHRGRQHFVLRIGGSDAGGGALAEEVEVQVGRRRPGFVEILTGLAEGDQVAIAGIVRVRPGSPVRIAGREGGA